MVEREVDGGWEEALNPIRGENASGDPLSVVTMTQSGARRGRSESRETFGWGGLGGIGAGGSANASAGKEDLAPPALTRGPGALGFMMRPAGWRGTAFRAKGLLARVWASWIACGQWTSWASRLFRSPWKFRTRLAGKRELAPPALARGTGEFAVICAHSR